MNSRALHNLEIRISSARLIVLAALFLAAVAASSPAWPAATEITAKITGVSGMPSFGELAGFMHLPGAECPSGHPSANISVDRATQA
jgi:hypothetical protein